MTLSIFGYRSLKLNQQLQTSIEFHFVQALHENAQNIFGRRYFGGTGFLQNFTSICFLTIEKREQCSFKSKIARWFNPT